VNEEPIVGGAVALDEPLPSLADARARRRPGLGSRAGRLLWILFIVYSVLPLVATALFSLSTRWMTTMLPEGLSLESYQAMLREDQFLPSLLRSIVLASGTLAVVTVLCVPLLTWIHIRAPKLAPPAEVISLIPFALPWVVVALALVRFYGDVYPRILNTPLLLLLAHGAVSIPYMYWALDNNMRAINARSLYEAGATLGARWDQTLRYALLPNLGPGLTTGGMLVFASSFGEYALSRLIVGAGWQTLPVWQASLINRDARVTSAVTVVGIAVAVLASVAITFWASRLRGEAAAGANEGH
jgi:putative spermidine/putrescine transport system permease protein